MWNCQADARRVRPRHTLRIDVVEPTDDTPREMGERGKEWIESADEIEKDAVVVVGERDSTSRRWSSRFSSAHGA